MTAANIVATVILTGRRDQAFAAETIEISGGLVTVTGYEVRNREPFGPLKCVSFGPTSIARILWHDPSAVGA